MGAFVLIAVAGAVIAAVVVYATTRNRRPDSRPGGAPGISQQPMGYAPQHPIYPPAQQPYPQTPNQGYASPPGQAPQYPNPYAQPPSHPGQQLGQ